MLATFLCKGSMLFSLVTAWMQRDLTARMTPTLLRTLLLLPLLGVSLLLSSEFVLAAPHSFENGSLDLSEKRFSNQEIYALDTQWQIAWNDFYPASEVVASEIRVNTEPFYFPQVWNALERSASTSEHAQTVKGPYGHATLYLTVTVPENLPGLYVKLPDLPSAATLWANGIKLLEQGKPGASKETEHPGFGPQTAYVNLSGQNLSFGLGSSGTDPAKEGKQAQKKVQLTLHLSNYHYKEGGSWNSILISGDSGFNRLTTYPAVTDTALTLLLLVLGGLFLSLYLARPQETAALMFSLFCIAIGFRNGITGEHIINQLTPWLSWHVSQKLEHILFFVSLPLFIAFTHRLYPQYKSPKAETLFWTLAGLFSAFTLATPSTIFTLTGLPYQILVITGIIYMLRIATLAVLHKRKSSVTYLLSFIILAMMVIGDLLTYNMIIKLPIKGELGISLFVIMQAWLLNQRYAFSLTNEEFLSQRLKEQNVELQKLDLMKDDFLAQTSHELRTPIHGISSLTEMVLNDEQGLSTESQANLQLIHSSSNRLANLVNDILDLSSIKHSNLKLNLVSVALLPIIEQVTHNLRPLLKGRPVTLQVHCPDWLPKIMADESRLQQIFYNLIGNAIKFTLEGSIEILVEMSQKDTVRISIKDTGLGIDHSQVKEIFEPYKQASQGLSASGHGLGLTITQNLLQMHHSQLELKSIPGHGSTFSFELEAAVHLPHQVQTLTQVPAPTEVAPPTQVPAATQAKTPTQEQIDSAPSATAVSDQTTSIEETADKKKASDYSERRKYNRRLNQNAQKDEHPLMIWAVDDEPVNLQIIETQLKHFGYQSRCFNSGQLMLDALEQVEQPDMILLDVMMPGLNGLEVCAKIREDFNSLDLPIIMLTARQQTSDIIQAFDAGASDYLAKPYNQAELKARVNAQMQSSLCHTLSQNNDALLTEIEKKEQLEKQLANRNRLLLSAFDTSTTAFAVLDHQYQVEYQNLSMKKIIEAHSALFNDSTAINSTITDPSFTDQPFRKIGEFISSHQEELSQKKRVTEPFFDSALNITVHAFEHQQQQSYSIILGSREQASSAHTSPDTDIENRVKLLEEIVSKLGEQQLAESSVQSIPSTKVLDQNSDTGRLSNTEETTVSALASSQTELSESQSSPQNPADNSTISDQIRTEEQARDTLVEATRLALRLWEKHTGKNKAELAEESKIWRVYIDGGTIKTRTLDKYLSIKTMPKRPRWRSVIKTLDYVNQYCKLNEKESDKLEQLTQAIEKDQLSK